MQKLNAREYYVIILTAILAMLLMVFLYNELFSESSPLITGEDGSFVNVRSDYLINIGNTFLQIILAITAFVSLLRKKRPGWIAAISLIFFYAFLITFLVTRAALAGLVDQIFWIGVLLAVMLLLAIIFLLFPSTLKKFNITKTAFVPVLIILALLATIYFVIPQ
jgi:hypothetical protein